MKKFLKIIAILISIYSFVILGVLLPNEMAGTEFFTFMTKGIICILIYSFLEFIIDRNIK